MLGACLVAVHQQLGRVAGDGGLEAANEFARRRELVVLLLRRLSLHRESPLQVENMLVSFHLRLGEALVSSGDREFQLVYRILARCDLLADFQEGILCGFPPLLEGLHLDSLPLSESLYEGILPRLEGLHAEILPLAECPHFGLMLQLEGLKFGFPLLSEGLHKFILPHLKHLHKGIMLLPLRVGFPGHLR